MEYILNIHTYKMKKILIKKNYNLYLLVVHIFIELHKHIKQQLNSNILLNFKGMPKIGEVIVA